ncbi:UNVERIFIED_CONTAM: hypothetical protein Slati_3723500 [Sesamum latifolium]|uniref:Uncharacterized protein n=1 Tax=Sesamum latifolium TaxID=2727402 RepID=A0AAW2U3D0_9LAMI
MQFQVDGNLQYVCPTCRGECCQIRNLEEAVQELWRRRDEADRDLIASFRAAAGLPTEEEIFDISPFSDDEESGPMLKNEYSRLKFSLKGLGDKSPRKSKEVLVGTLMVHLDILQAISRMKKCNFLVNLLVSPVAGDLTDGVSAANEGVVSKHKNVDEVTTTNVTKASRTIKIKSSQSHGLTNREESGTNSGGPKTTQGPKLVIHLGGRTRNAASPPRSEGSSFKRSQELPSSNGVEDTSQLKHPEYIDRPDTGSKFGDSKGHKIDHTDQIKGAKLRQKDSHLIKFKNGNSELSNISSKLTGGEFADGYESVSPKNTYSILGKRGTEDSASVRSSSEVPASTKDRKPFLKFKIPKNSNSGNQNVPSNFSTGTQNPLPLPGKEEITYTRGQRSKRRRPGQGDEDATQWREDTMKDFTDANWILQKLGKDAAGKRVEVHQASNKSWHRGTVVEVFEGTSVVSIAFDDGKTKSFELGKQGIRFVSQKQKH